MYINKSKHTYKSDKMEILESKPAEEYEHHAAPLLETKPQLPAEMVNTIEKYVSNPMFQILAASKVPEIRDFITENAGDYEPLVYEYLKSKYPSIFALLQQGENNAGMANYPPGQTDTRTIGQNGLNGEFESPDDEPELTKELWDSILEDMVEMEKDGYSPGKISRIIQEDHGIELSHQQVRTHLERFKRSEKARLAQEAQEQDEERREIERQAEINMRAQKKILTLAENYEKVRAEKVEIEKKLAVLEALDKAKKPDIPQGTPERIGLIRKIGRWLY